MSAPRESEASVAVRRVTGGTAEERDDTLAVEEPMEIRIGHGPADARAAQSLSVTMRTPGNDFELAAGFLFTEGILASRDQVTDIQFCGPPAPGRETSNIVRVELDNGVQLDMGKLQRHFFTTSSCGICGKASLDALEVQGLQDVSGNAFRIDGSIVHELPARLRESQPVFDSTGGLHAAGLVDASGAIVEVREDVGRHNAVDKLIGRRFLDGGTPLGDHGMVVSGRASFEILQKALVAGLPLIVAVGAPSSLAVGMAERFGMTLVGFASADRFNIYTGAERISC
jgi:FdhD protein